MGWISIIGGLITIGLALYTIFGRTRHPRRFRDFGRFQRAFGQRAGTLVHTITYIIMPIGVGVFLIIMGLGELGAM